MYHWDELFWDWPDFEGDYGLDKWGAIVEGLRLSLVDAIDVPLKLGAHIMYDIDHPTPRVVFTLTHEPPQAFLPRIVGRCAINIWDEDDGSRKIHASVSFYYFQGETRLDAENGTVCLEYELVKTEAGQTTWQSCGWLHDSCGETEGCSWDNLRS